MRYPLALQNLISEFSEIDDMMERLELLMEFGEEVEGMNESECSEANIVRGCQSRAHLVVEDRNDRLWIRGAADAKIVQGLMGILAIAVNGSSYDEVLHLSPDFAKEMGILNTLTPSRSNGFRTMFDMILNEARVKLDGN